MEHTPTLVPINTLPDNGHGEAIPLHKSGRNTLVIDPSALIPAIIEALTGEDSKELQSLAIAIDSGHATKRDKRRLVHLLNKARKRISN